MRLGLVHKAAGAACLAMAATGVAVWLVADAAAAVQTTLVVGAVLAMGLLHLWQTRRLAWRVEALRRLVLGLDTGDPAVTGAAARVVPQEHFERLAQLLAANNQRLEVAIDDLAGRMTGATVAEPALSPGGHRRPGVGTGNPV